MIENEALLEALDRYILEDKKCIEMQLREKKVNPRATEWRGALTGFLLNINPAIKAKDLLNELRIARSAGVVENLSHSNFIEEQFKLIEKSLIPKYFHNLLEEVKERYLFINKFISNRENNWSEKEKEDYYLEIIDKAKNNSFDKDSQKRYLKKRFQDILSELADIEKMFSLTYGYDLDLFYRKEDYKDTEKLSRFFFLCQLSQKTIRAFQPVHQHFRRYIYLQNELEALRQLLLKDPEKIKEGGGQKENPYPEIFPDYFSFKLFERLYDSHKGDKNNHLATFSFIYRKMYAEGYILEYQKPEMFRLWLSKKDIVIEYKFKTLANCAPQSKLPEYETAKELVKLELNK